MTEVAPQQDINPRKKLYSALVGNANPEAKNHFKQFSFEQFNKRLDDEKFVEDLYESLRSNDVVLDAKNRQPEQNYYDFIDAYVKVPTAKPAPKPKAAPVAAPVAVEEEEAYIPPPQPAIGSPEYDKRLQAQYGGMAPTLGATFGGVPAAFETKAQKKQEQISPAFKAQKLAFEDVPIAEEQRRAQRQFAKATKERQQAALRGGTGYELQQQQADEARESTEKLKDFGSYIGATLDNMIDKAKGAERIFAAKQRALLTFGDRGKKAEQEEKEVKQDIYNYISELDQDFAAKQADYNIEGNLFEALRKGQWDRVPEAFAYNLAQIGVNALGAATTGGYSTFAQVMPDIYKAGVEEIARKTKTTPEQVIASGNDKEVLSYIGGGISGYLDYLSGGILGQTMRSQGAYKFLRDKALDKIGKTKWKQAAASAVALGGTSGIEGATELGQGLIEVATPQVAAADTFKEARENIYKELQKPETQRRLAGEFVGGLAGGGGIAAGGRALGRVLEGDFTYGDVGKATQRADYDVVQTDNKITERNKIAQAMEEAVKANPEAEGQIRQQYQKRINEAAPKDEEVLSAYESLSVLPETEEKNAIRENLEGYMAEKGIQAEPTGMDAGLGELMRREPPIVQTVNPDFPPPVTEEEVTEELTPEEEDEDLAAFGRELEAIEQAAPVAPAEEEVVAEEVPAEPIAPATEEEKQKSLEDEIESIKAQINSFRSEDGSVPSGKRAEFDRLVNLLTQATANAKRGNSTSVTPIRVIPEDIANQAPAFITDANEKAEAADLIEQAIQSSKTWEEAMRKIRKLGYVFDANDNMLLANYLKDRFNPDAPRIGNNKDSFQAWVNGKTDADLAAPEAVSAAPVEEAATQAPAAPAPKGKKKKEAPVQNPKREDFPESQSNTRTPVTQKLLDYFADAFGIPRFTEDLSKGTYIKWLQNANNTGYEVASKLNAPKQAFDVIAQGEKERSKAAALAPKAETKQAAPVTPAPAAPKKEEGISDVKVPEGKGGWRVSFNETQDVARKNSILEEVASSSTNPNELRDAYEAAKQTEKETNRVNWAIANNKNTPQDVFDDLIKSKALERTTSDEAIKSIIDKRAEVKPASKAKAQVGIIKPTNQPQMDTKSNPKLKHDPSIKERGDFKIGDEAQWRSSDPKNKAKGTVVGFTPDDYYNVFLKLSTPYNDGWGWRKAGDIVLVKGAFLNNLRLQAEQQVKEEQSIDDVKSKKFREAFEERFGGANGLSYDGINTALRDIPEDASGKQFLEIADGVKESDKKLAAATTKMLFNKMRFDPDFNDERELIKTNRKAAIDSLKWMAENGLPIPQDLAKEAGIKTTPATETKEGKKAEAKEEWIGKTKEQYISDRTSEILNASESYQKKVGSKDKADQKTAAYLRDEAGKKAEQEYDKLFSEALKNKTLPNEYKPNYLLTSTEKVDKDEKRYTEAGYPQNHNEKLSREEHKEEVQSAVDNGLYAKAIEDGVLSYDEAAKIIESAGVKVPQSLTSAPSFASQQSSEAATAFDKGITIEEKGPDSDFSNRTLYSTDEGKLEIGKRKGRKYYSVLELFVNEESRRKGTATKLLKQAIRDTKGLISSQVSNDVSLEAHYKLGMRAYENGKELSLDEAKKLRQKQTSVNVRFSNAEYEKELHDLYQKRAQELSEIRETRSSNNALQKKYRNEVKTIIDKFGKSSSKDIANQVALVELPSNVKKALIDKDFDRAIELTKSDEDFVEDFYNKKIKELEQKYPNPEITKDVARILKETVAAPSTVDKGQVSGEVKTEPGALKEFTSTQSSEITTAFDKAKTSKGFDKKYGKGAYKALSDITKNFEDIMDKVSEKIKQDCIV